MMKQERKTEGPATARIRTLVSLIVTCLLCCGVLAADDRATGVDDMRAAMEQWVETRRIISKERRDWELGREMLNDRIDLVAREIESLQDKISSAETSITEADKKRAELIETNEKLKEASLALADIVAELEQGTSALVKRLPDPLTQRIRPLSQKLPERPDETELSLAERFQNVIGILNDINKFNREITVTSELRTLPDGTQAEVTALYVGIGQGYYVGATGSVAGVGTAGDDGWVWTPANVAAPQIAESIAIVQNEEVASFVKMPVEIQ